MEPEAPAWRLRHRCLRFRCHGRLTGGRAIQFENPILNAGYDLVVLFVVLEEVGNIQERVPIQSDIDECRLHSGQNTRDPAFVDAAGQRILVFALMVDFDHLVVFDHRYAGLVPVGRNH
jgi:hypothetical protein